MAETDGVKYAKKANKTWHFLARYRIGHTDKYTFFFRLRLIELSIPWRALFGYHSATAGILRASKPAEPAKVISSEDADSGIGMVVARKPVGCAAGK